MLWFRRIALLSVLLIAVGAMAIATSPIQAGAASIAFSTPTVVDPIHTFGEPDIGIDPLGRVFVSGPTTVGNS